MKGTSPQYAIKSFTYCLLILCMYIKHIHSQNLITFDGHLLQRIKEKEQEFGSWRAGLKGTVLLAKDAAKPNSRRGIAFAEFTDLALDPHLFEIIIERSTGLIITVPPNITQFLEEKYEEIQPEGSKEVYVSQTLQKLKNFENTLLTRKFSLAMYFAWQTEQLTEIFKNLAFSGNKLINSRVTVATKLNEPKVIDFIKGYNFIGWSHLPHDSESDETAVTTIAFVAHYDVSTVVPGMSLDISGTSSGLIAFTTLIHQFGSFVAKKSPDNVKVIFLLFSGSTSDFFGAYHWLSQADQILLDSIDFALCLDSLVEPNLNLHLTKPVKSPAAQKFIQALNTSSATHGLGFDVTIDKIDINGPSKWPHELFSRKGIQSGTLSNSKLQSSTIGQKSIFDNLMTDSQQQSLLKQIKIISEATGHFMYNLDDYKIELFESLDDMSTFSNSWKTGLSQTPRFFRTMKKNDPFFSEIENLFTLDLLDFEKQEFTLTNDPRDYYQDFSVNLTLRKTKSPLFDAFHFLFNALYLSIIYIIVTEGKAFNVFKKWLSSIYIFRR